MVCSSLWVPKGAILATQPFPVLLHNICSNILWHLFSHSPYSILPATKFTLDSSIQSSTHVNRCACPLIFSPHQSIWLKLDTPHTVGKWHLGFCRPSCLPTGRGFQSFLGTLTGSGDHFSYQSCDGAEACGFDLHDGDRPAWEMAGNYSTLLCIDG